MLRTVIKVPISIGGGNIVTEGRDAIFYVSPVQIIFPVMSISRIIISLRYDIETLPT